MLWQDTRVALHIVHFMLFMSLLSIQLIFSLSSFVCFLFFPIYMQVFRGLEPIATGEQVMKISRRHRLLRAYLLFIYAFMSFHSMLYYDTFMSTFRWTFVLQLCFDNGGVHNLLVGCEPIHCNLYPILFIYRFQTYLSYPWWGDTL